MSTEHADHPPPQITAQQTVSENGERSLSTSLDQSVLEKPSLAPASIHSDTPKLDTEEERKDDHDKKLRTMDSNDPDAEPVYPGMITKVLVGAGLALAVFLVSTLDPWNGAKIRCRWIRPLWLLLSQRFQITFKH